MKALFVCLIVGVVSEISVLALITRENTGLISTFQLLFSVFEFSAISYIYMNEFTKLFHKRVIWVFALFYAISVSIVYINTRDLSQVIEVADIVEASLIIILSLFFFFKVFTDLEIPRLTDYPFFWVNSAFLIYFGTSFFIFLFNHVIKDFDETIIYFLAGIHHIINITYNILLTVAICKVKKP